VIYETLRWCQLMPVIAVNDLVFLSWSWLAKRVVIKWTWDPEPNSVRQGTYLPARFLIRTTAVARSTGSTEYWDERGWRETDSETDGEADDETAIMELRCEIIWLEPGTWFSGGLGSWTDFLWWGSMWLFDWQEWQGLEEQFRASCILHNDNAFLVETPAR